MDIEQIKAWITLLETSKLCKLSVKQGDFELHLEKETEWAASPVRRNSPAESLGETAFQSEIPLKGERGGGRIIEVAGNFVTSPMVGTFYTAPAPDQPPFVKIGDEVSENSVVCIIEAMKVLNEVKAGMKGRVVEVLVDNAQPVEFGTRLFRIL